MTTSTFATTRTGTSLTDTSQPAGVLQRKCACGSSPGPTGECASCRRKRRRGLQAKLRVGSPHDRLEREADRISQMVVASRPQNLPLSGHPLASEVTGAALAAPKLLRRVDGSAVASDIVQAPEIVNDVLMRPGRPLETDTRSDMEARMGFDFSHVRVHHDARAAESARAVNARAYTVGHHIVFGAGEYGPGSTRGRRLIAHELTHVVQQSNHAEVMLRRQAPAAAPQVGQLTSTQRAALHTLLVSRLGSAEVDFSNACSQVREDLASEAKARALFVKTVIDIASAFVVPGLGPAIVRLVNHIPASASVGVHAVALGIQDQASNIASAIGGVAKGAAHRAVDSAFASNPRDFCNLMIEGFQATKDGIASFVARNIENRSALPDENLWLYVSNWDPGEITTARYATVIRDIWNRYEAQILRIGETRREHRSTLDFSGTEVKTAVVWVQIGNEVVMILADERAGAGRLDFVEWISEDLEEAATERFAQISGRRPVIRVPASAVRGLPGDIPNNVARHRA